MSISGIVIAAVLVGGVGLFIGLFLGIAGMKFQVEVDEKEEAVLAALLGVPAAEHPAVLFGGGRLAGLVAAYKGLAGNIGPAMPAQVKADRYQLVPLGGEGNIVVNDHSIARNVLVAGCILPTGNMNKK